MANIGDAKYLLFKHTGGEFTVRLRRNRPVHWAVLTPLRDALDGALAFGQQHGGDLPINVFPVQSGQRVTVAFPPGTVVQAGAIMERRRPDSGPDALQRGRTLQGRLNW